MIKGDPAAVPDRAAPGITRVTAAVSEPGEAHQLPPGGTDTRVKQGD